MDPIIMWDEIFSDCMSNGVLFGSRRFDMDNQDSDFDIYVLDDVFHKHRSNIVRMMNMDESHTITSHRVYEFTCEGVKCVLDESNKYNRKLHNIQSLKVTIGDLQPINLVLVKNLVPYLEINERYEDMLGENTLLRCQNNKKFRHRLYEFVVDCVFKEDEFKEFGIMHNNIFVEDEDEDIPF